LTERDCFCETIKNYIIMSAFRHSRETGCCRMLSKLTPREEDFASSQNNFGILL
jgi:hypothetical protein